jgi:DNA-binding HxlR family transcriptional regulator
MKRYGQYCPVAHALDLIGDRWALLVVRELMLGQRRYTDLADALPGIGTNILAARLRSLEAAGVVRRTKLPPPAAVSVYELTETGRALDDVLHSLARWGALTLGAPQADDCWSMYAVHARFRPDAAVDGTYEIRFVGGEVITLGVREGALSAAKAPADEATLAVELEPAVLHAMIEGRLATRRALADGGARLLAGTQADLAHLVAMFAPADAAAAEAEAAA